MPSMSTNTPLPAPSKAAIRALRGIVLGTSCTLALVTEDHRRRINAARDTLHNADRLRSARRYHSSGSNGNGSALANALYAERSLASEPTPAAVHWQPVPPMTTAVEGDIVLLPQQVGARQNGRRIRLYVDGPAPPPSPPDMSALEKPREMLSQKEGQQRVQKVQRVQGVQKEAEQREKEEEQREPEKTESRDRRPLATSLGMARFLQQPIPSLAEQAHEYQARLHQPRMAETLPAMRLVDLPAAVDRLAALVEGADVGSATRETPRLEEAVQLLQSAESLLAGRWSSVNAAAMRERLQQMLQLSGQLCCACQRAGRMDLAQAVLHVAVQSDQLTEETYFAHDPSPVVKAAVDALDGDASSGSSLREQNSKLREAAALFLPPCPGKRQRSAAAFLSIGKMLLEAAFSVGNERLISSIYASIAAYTAGDISALTHWYLGQLHTRKLYAPAVSTFCARPPSAEQLEASAYADVAVWVTRAAMATKSARAAEILRCLVRGGPAPEAEAEAEAEPRGARIQTTQVIQLLYCQWQATHDYADIHALYSELYSSSSRPQGVYRVMVQIALQAGRPDEAQSLFDEAIQQRGAAVATDVGFLGLFAQDRAREGDWAGVRDCFERAQGQTGDQGQKVLAPEAARVFVPIVKSYLQTHTIGETEDFLRLYIGELGVPVGRDMVTLLAKEYGALREVDSFVRWLEFCAQAGLAMDASFGEAVLNSCRKHWRFNFRDLRVLFRQLSVLSPGFATSDVAGRILTHAALSEVKQAHPRRPLKGRPVSLGGSGRVVIRMATRTIHASAAAAAAAAATSTERAEGGDRESAQAKAAPRTSRALLGQHLDDDTLYLHMRKAFVSGSEGRTVRLYRQAVLDRGGVHPDNSKFLKLAVAAAVRRGQKAAARQDADALEKGVADATDATDAADVEDMEDIPFDGAMELLRAAKAAGTDIDEAAAYVAVAWIEAESLRQAQSAQSAEWTREKGNRDGAAAAVRAVLGQLMASGMQPSDMALNRAAFHLFKASHMRGAIALALEAVKAAARQRQDARGGGGGGKTGQKPVVPGYNAFNFSVLAAAYGRLADAAGIRMVVEGAAASGVSGELMGVKVLKQARRQLRAAADETSPDRASAACTACTESSVSIARKISNVPRGTVQEALAAVEDGLARARAARQKVQAERTEVEAAVLRIMRQAAEDAARLGDDDSSISSVSTEGVLVV